MSFYENYKKLTDYAPYADYTFYSGAFSETQTYTVGKEHRLVPDGTSIYERLIEAIPDTAMKMVIVEDILSLGRNIINNLDSINVLRSASVKDADDTLSLPVAMTKYAHLYYKYAGNPKYYPAYLYDKVQARENYRTAFKMLRDRNIDPGQELEGFYVNEYYKTCEELFKSDEEKYYEQFLDDYLEIVQTCDNLLIPFYDIPDSIKNYSMEPRYTKFRSYNYYTNHNVEGVKALFKASGASTPERLNDYFISILPEHENDHEYMEKALYVMRELKADRSQAYYKYSKTSYPIRPTYLNCLGCAFLSWEEENLEAMDAYCSLADSLAPDSLSKGLVYFYTAMEIPARRVGMQKSSGKIVPKDSLEYQKWDYEMTLASQYLNKMMDLSATFAKSPKIEQRGYPYRAAYHFYDIQRMIGHTKRETSYIKDAGKYIQLYASHQDLIGIEQKLSQDISQINKQIDGISSIGLIPMSTEEHRFLNDLYRAVLKIFTEELEFYGATSFSGLDKNQKKLMIDYEKYYKIYSTERTGMTSQQKAQYNTFLNKKKKYK